MAIRYHHTQRGTLILATMAVATILSASAAYLNPSSPARWLLVGFAIGFVVLAWLFSSSARRRRNRRRATPARLCVR